MTDDAQSPVPTKSAVNSKSPQPTEDPKDATVGSSNASPEKTIKIEEEKDNASAEETSQEGKQEEEGGDEKEESEEAPAGVEDGSKTPKKKAADSRKTPNKRKGSGNLKNGTPASTKKPTPREYKPEDIVLHKLKGYPPWPAVILSDEVAELKLDLVKAKPGGGGKRKGAKPAEGAVRTSYPVSYLHNFYEYSYAPISDLEPLTKAKIEEFSPKGRKKDLIDAYEVAKQGVTLDMVREAFTADVMSIDEQEEAPEEAEDVEMEEAEEEEEEEEEEEDEEPEDEEEEEKPKKTPKKGGKKRKAAEASEEDEGAEELEKKPAKTPKRSSTAKTPSKAKTPRSSVKAPAKTPNGETKKKISATPKPKSTKKAPAKKESKSSKSKKMVETEEEEEEEEEEKPQEQEKQPEEPVQPQLSADDERVRKKKEILYIRHRLQKGLLSRATVPSENEMPQISAHIAELESMGDFDVSNIRDTKINKVLKMITKLSSIPHDDKYKIRERAVALLEKVNQKLAEEPEPVPEVAENVEGGEKEKESGAGETKEKINGADLPIQTKEKETVTMKENGETKEESEDKGMVDANAGEGKDDGGVVDVKGTEGKKEDRVAVEEDRDTAMSE